jgi:hypothetical protein
VSNLSPAFIPCYNGHELWFWHEAATGEPIYPGQTCRLLDGASHVRWFHDEADKSTAFGYCYFIGGEAGPIKIGYSVCPKDRLRQIQYHSPQRLSILAIRNGGLKREAAYHEQFAAYRLHGEWFERCPEIEAEIARLNAKDPTP